MSLFDSLDPLRNVKPAEMQSAWVKVNYTTPDGPRDYYGLLLMHDFGAVCPLWDADALRGVLDAGTQVLSGLQIARSLDVIGKPTDRKTISDN